MKMQAHSIEETILQRSVTSQIATREGVNVRSVRRWKEPMPSNEMPDASGLPGRIEACDRYLGHVNEVNPPGADLGAAYIAERQEQRTIARVRSGSLTWATARTELARTIGSVIDALIREETQEAIELKILQLQAVATRALCALGLRGNPLPPARQIKS
jgi:hypothetical protein